MTRSPFSKPVNGFTLIELMIALLLGLLVVSAAIAIFLSNSRTLRATQSLGRVQESARAAYELMARDLREAGGNPCNASLPTTNILKQPGNAFWTTWAEGVRGYDGSTVFSNPTGTFGAAAGDRVSGSDAVEVKYAAATGSRLTAQMASKTAALTVDSTTGIAANDVVMVCDFELLSIFQVTALSATSLSHATADNCTDGFTDKNPCGAGPGSLGAWHRYGPDAMIAIPQSLRWYVAYNGRGGRSLYRTVTRGAAGALKAADTQEIVDGVEAMSLSYLVEGGSDYVAAGSVAANNWPNVTAVQVQITKAGEVVDGATLTRNITHVVNLRNHSL